MAALTTQHVVAAGTAPSFGAAAASDTAEIGSGNNTFVVYKNGDTNEKTITIVSDLSLDSGDGYPDKVYTLAADTGELWIPLIKDYDSGGSAPAGSATLAVTGTGGVTGVTVAVVRRS